MPSARSGGCGHKCGVSLCAVFLCWVFTTVILFRILPFAVSKHPSRLCVRLPAACCICPRPHRPIRAEAMLCSVQKSSFPEAAQRSGCHYACTAIYGLRFRKLSGQHGCGMSVSVVMAFATPLSAAVTALRILLLSARNVLIVSVCYCGHDNAGMRSQCALLCAII